MEWNLEYSMWNGPLDLIACPVLYCGLKFIIMEANRVEFMYSTNRTRPPSNVTHVKIEPSVTVISAGAFDGCTKLIHVELVEGLERIEKGAFDGCTSLENVIIPSSVKTLEAWAFYCCTNLIHVELLEGLEQIEESAFQGCTSLVNVIIPSTVNTIGVGAFGGCTDLIHVELVEGLQKIGDGAFEDCTFLLSVIIPSTVKYIGVNAFENCTSLFAVIFCAEIEEFVSLASLQSWWNHGRSKMSLYTYNHLVRYNIPQRTESIKIVWWKSNIHAMVQQIPSVASISRHLVQHFDRIESLLSNYERLQTDIAPLLMLVIWKSTISDEIGNDYTHDSVNVDEMKLEGRYDSESMMCLIVQNVLDFLCIQVNKD